MQRIPDIKLFFSLCLISLFFNACTDAPDLFDSNALEELYKNTFPVSNISEKTDWKTVRSVNTDILIDYDFDRDHRYLIEIFDSNPLTCDNPIRLDYSFVNKAMDMRYSSDICIPYSTDSLAICVTDPFGRRIVKETVVKNDRISCTFTDKATTSVKTMNVYANFDIPDMPYYSSIPDNAIELSEWISQNPWQGLPSNTDFKITHNFNGFPSYWGGSNVRIFVAADWNIDNSTIQSGMEIIIMPHGYVNAGEYYMNINNQSGFSIMEGARLDVAAITYTNEGILNNAGKVNITNDLIIYNGVNIINYGELSIKRFSDSSGNENYGFYNTGNFVVRGDFFKNAGLIYNSNQFNVLSEFKMGSRGKCINDSYFKSQEFVITWSSVDEYSLLNNCLIETESFDCEGATIVFGDNSSLISTKNINFNQTRANLGAGAYIKGNEISIDYGNYITGTGNSKALLKADRIIQKNSNSKKHGVTYSGNLQIATDKHFSNTHNEYILTGNSDMVGYNNNTVSIPQTKCSEGIDTDTGNPTDPEPGEQDVIKYTFAFEDTFPQMGDYDLNDYVADLWIDNYTYAPSGMITGATLYLKSRAVGAGKRLGLGLNLEGFTRSDIASVTSDRFNITPETNGTLAVIPVTNDIHKFVGAETRNLYNTIMDGNSGYYFEPFITEYALTFTNEVYKERLNIDKIDLFIYTGYPQQRIETHLSGKRNTHLASNSERYDEYIKKYTWALCIPDFRYPVEGRRIITAYPDFQNWASDPDTYSDWYKKPVAEHLYTK